MLAGSGQRVGRRELPWRKSLSESRLLAHAGLLPACSGKIKDRQRHGRSNVTPIFVWRWNPSCRSAAAGAQVRDLANLVANCLVRECLRQNRMRRRVPDLTPQEQGHYRLLSVPRARMPVVTSQSHRFSVAASQTQPRIPLDSCAPDYVTFHVWSEWLFPLGAPLIYPCVSASAQ